MLIETGEVHEAVELLERALGERGVAAPDWFFQLGRAYLELGRVEDAAASRALEIDPTHSGLRESW